MKVRSGFVTNSSSSSFIMAFNNSDRWTSYNYFKEICDDLDYEEFYNLIDQISSDYLVLSNETKVFISARQLIDKINPVDFGAAAYLELKKLYEEDYFLKPYEVYPIKINDIENNNVDLNKLNFEDIYDDEEDKYCISITRNDENRSKEQALEKLYNYYSWEYSLELIEEYGELNLKQRQEIRESAEFKEKIKTYMDNNEEYQEKKKKLEDANFVVNGMIWDTNGGILEWAIRNDFIKNNFPRNHVYTLHVG